MRVSPRREDRAPRTQKQAANCWLFDADVFFLGGGMLYMGSSGTGRFLNVVWDLKPW